MTTDRRGKRIDDALRQDILSAYLSSRDTTTKVAARFGVSNESVRRIIRAHNGDQPLARARKDLPALGRLSEADLLHALQSGTVGPEVARAALEAIVSRDMAIERLITRLERPSRAPTPLNAQIDALINQVLHEEHRANQLQRELDKLKESRK